jgi:hypothetical protein
MENTKKLNKLVLNQESLRNLTATEVKSNLYTHNAACHTHVVSNCPFPCTPAN